jgi:hypothetical protein
MSRWFVSYDRGKRVGSVPFLAADTDHQFIVQLAEDARVSCARGHAASGRYPSHVM